MHFSQRLKLFLGLLGLLFLTACQGNSEGPLSLGPSASTTPNATYYYNSSFDTQANASEWNVYLRGGSGSIQVTLDSLVSQSPSRSLAVDVSGTVFTDSLAYINRSFLVSKDIWLEFDWLLAGLSGENEVVISLAGVNKASIGYNATGIFLTDNGVRIYPTSGISTATWHHVRMVVSPGTGLSSYWLDNASIGTNISTTLNVIGGPTGDYAALKLAFNPGDQVNLDNFRVYRY